MIMDRGKRGAEETSVFIFVVLGLIVLGLVSYFGWSFFSKGVDYIDASDQTVQFALQSCSKVELTVNPDSWCTVSKYVPYANAKQYVSCYYLNIKTGNTISVPDSVLEKCKTSTAAQDYCMDLSKTQGNFKELVNGEWCEQSGTKLTYGADKKVYYAWAGKWLEEAEAIVEFEKKCTEEPVKGTPGKTVCAVPNPTKVNEEKIGSGTYYCCKAA